VRRSWVALPAAVAAVALGGCGSAGELPPAPEPAVSPPLTERPAGRVVRVGSNPEGLAADPRTGLVAVGLRNPDRLALVDGETGRVMRDVRLPESPRHLQLSPAGSVLVPAERANALVEVPLPHGRPRVTPTGRFPHDAAAVGGRIVVANEHDDSLSVAERGRVVRALDAPRQPGGVAAAGGSLAVVVGVRARRVALFDVIAARKLGEATAGVGATHVVAAGGFAYVADTEGDAILVYRLRPKLEFLDRANLPGAPYGMALDRRRRRLWITLTERNEVVRYDLTHHAPRRIASYPTVRQPNSVAVNETSGRVYVASRTGSELQILGR
jgi:DNA-binding beta-propeller fold protein YncE